ncbi:ACT domain-containing protein [Streptomyces sp. NPDC086989]|uniref:ACT domain-containing protein n=1 Tax=Streptomyces sp. NPDC086989 TaxID=3365764 RepID=UPI003817272D
MAGERDLQKLLASMSPRLDEAEYVFTLAPGGEVPADVRPFVTVREDEGLTLVLLREEADQAGLAYDYVAARITLRVHSALDAVGLTAAVATALAEVGLSCNVVAGLHHDHLFVAYAGGGRASAVLAGLAAGGS